MNPVGKIDHPNAVFMDHMEGREHLTSKTLKAFR